MTPLEKLKALLVSRRFIAAAVTVLVVISNHYGLDLSEEQLMGLVITVSSWLIGDSLQKTGTIQAGALPESVAQEAHRRVKARSDSYAG